MPALIIMSLFRIGPSMIILLAGLQGIPQSLYEAAEIDGAGRWAKLQEYHHSNAFASVVLCHRRIDRRIIPNLYRNTNNDRRRTGDLFLCSGLVSVATSICILTYGLCLSSRVDFVPRCNGFGGSAILARQSLGLL